MQIMQVNNYTGLKQQKKQDCSMQTNKTNCYINVANKKQSNISFSGVNKRWLNEFIAKSKNVSGDAAEKAAKIIGEAKEHIKGSVKRTSKLPKLEGTLGEIEQKAQKQKEEIHDKSWFFTDRKIAKVEMEEANAKARKLDEMGKSVAQKTDEAAENKSIADALPGLIKQHERAFKKVREERADKAQEVKTYHQANKGLDKIAGYELEKNALEELFINVVKVEKKGEDVKAPGSVLFFGPTGNGKTTFTNAFAEQTGCHLVPIKFKALQPVNDKSRQALMDKVMKEAEAAEKRFKEDRTRTILHMDEVTNLASKNSNVLGQFEDFLATCSEKYHCTVVGTTNHLQNMGLDMSKDENFFARISVDAPTKDSGNAPKVFEYYFKPISEEELNFDEMANALFKKGEAQGGAYSNSQIEVMQKEMIETRKEMQDDKLREIKIAKGEITEADKEAVKEKIDQKYIIDHIRNYKQAPSITNEALQEAEKVAKELLGD